VYAAISRANYNLFLLLRSLSSLSCAALRLFPVAPVLLAASQPRYFLGLLTNNIKRPIFSDVLCQGTIHARAGTVRGPSRGGSAGWNLVERVSRPTRRTGAREVEEKASSRENHFELRSGEAIPSPTYGSVDYRGSLCNVVLHIIQRPPGID